MNREQAKKLLKITAGLYLASFLIINWNTVSWIFNYQEVSGLVSDFLNPYPNIDASSVDAYFYPNHSQNVAVAEKPTDGTTNGTQTVKNATTTYTAKQDTLEISKINISVPIIFSTSTKEAELMKDLNLGAVFYPGSVYPGQVGQIVILGHSAPPGWPHIKHDWLFTDLDKLAPGDKILIDVNNIQYTYIVKQTTIIKRGADVPANSSAVSNNVLTLISCWPPGKDYQRITVQAELLTS